MPLPITENSITVARQLGNAYLLLGFIGLSIFLSTSEVKVIKAYLFALWLGDIGHVFFCCQGLGWERVTSPSRWNAMFWGNAITTVRASYLLCCVRSLCVLTAFQTKIFLFLTRSLYLLGWLGSDKPSVAIARKKT